MVIFIDYLQFFYKSIKLKMLHTNIYIFFCKVIICNKMIYLNFHRSLLTTEKVFTIFKLHNIHKKQKY